MTIKSTTKVLKLSAKPLYPLLRMWTGPGDTNTLVVLFTEEHTGVVLASANKTPGTVLENLASHNEQDYWVPCEITLKSEA